MQTLRPSLWTQVSPARECLLLQGHRKLILFRDIVLRHEKSFHALDHPKRQPPPQPQVETEDTIVVETSPPSSNPSPVVSKPVKEEHIEPPRPAFEPEMSEEPLRDGHGLPLFHPSAFNNPPLQPPPTTLHPAFYPQNSYRQAPPAPNHEFHHAFSHYHAPPPHGMQHNTLDPRMFAPSNQQENQPPLDPLLQQYDEQRARKESIEGMTSL